MATVRVSPVPLPGRYTHARRGWNDQRVPYVAIGRRWQFWIPASAGMTHAPPHGAPSSSRNPGFLLPQE
ncbi:MAG: hypothetical protein OXR07_07315 [Nitrospira sp.]|nr:hypothetical protein [Nitrospira sp.]